MLPPERHCISWAPRGAAARSGRRAHAIYERLARAFPNQFYAMKARERLQQPEIAGAAVSDEESRFLAELKLLQAKPVPSEATRPTSLRIERSRVLRSAGLSDLADAELRFGARTDGQGQLLGLEMAEAAESPYVALRIMKAFGGDYLTLPMEQAPRKFWELLFPLPWRAEVESNARQRGVDPVSHGRAHPAGIGIQPAGAIGARRRTA